MSRALAIMGGIAFLSASAISQDVNFDRDIRPILADKCFQCHGPDAATRKAKLRLDVKSGVFGVRSDGVKLVVPGKPDASELMLRVLSEDEDEVMPPPGKGGVLSDEEKALLGRWVEQGARWEGHWSFVPPRAETPLQSPGTNEWVRNPIDAFVLDRLQQNGLSPSPEVRRDRWIRRVTFDLTGLPPEPSDVDAFLGDTAEGAYERVVDRLLGSSRYGEHMARFWLDVARYGDTHGLHLDNYREMWPYRDWVVKAFNANVPFDRFVVEQLAGDMLPDATLEQQVASGFNRCHITTNEGGAIMEEVYVRNVVDRTATAATVFMGLTMECAVCHDHKFDPISQQEFYEFFAFFNNLDGKPMDGNAKVHAPVVKVPTDGQMDGLARLKDERAGVEGETVEVLAKLTYREPRIRRRNNGFRRRIVLVEDELPQGAEAQGNGVVWGTRADHRVHTGRLSMKRQGKGFHQHFYPNADRKFRIGAGDSLFCWVWLDPRDPPREVMLQYNADGAGDWGHRAYWGENLIVAEKEGTHECRRMGDLPKPGRWVKLEVDADDIGLPEGAIVHGMAFSQFDGTVYWDTAGIYSATPQEPEDWVWIDDAPPKGVALAGNGKTWQWQQGPGHPVLSGDKSLRRGGHAGLNQDFFTGATPLVLKRGDRLFAHAWLDPKDPPRGIQLQFNDGTWNHRVRWGAACHAPGAKNGADFVAGELPETGKWVRLEVSIEEVGLKPGSRINGWAFTQQGGVVYWDKAGVKSWSPPDERHRISKRVWLARAVGDKTLPAPVKKALGSGRRTATEKKILSDHYLRHVHAGSKEVFEPLEKKLAGIDGKIMAIEKAIPTTLVMKERVKTRPAYLLTRGQYTDRGVEVKRGTPSILPPMSPGFSRDRLGLAKWLVGPDHPLTSRVAVNRLWQQVFGVGLVKTSEDFGIQGERPSHPGLLDWLAVQFRTDGWDIKKTMRRMVLSATYRQTSRVTPELLEVDPDNRLLSRGPRGRLDAEMIRDQALFVSGLLVERLGGPGVKPPQPAGLWKAVGYSGSNTVRFVADKEKDKIYRRSLYTFWKRTSPPPQMTTLDAPSREDCRVRRERTNTPLQALLLMNEAQFVEAARHLALRIIQEGGDTDLARIEYAFRLCASRLPGSDDLKEVLALLSSRRTAYALDTKAASSLAGNEAKARDVDAVEMAAWTVVANLILNLDEVLTKN